jgi:hypothetical protein
VFRVRRRAVWVEAGRREVVGEEGRARAEPHIGPAGGIRFVGEVGATRGYRQGRGGIRSRGHGRRTMRNSDASKCDGAESSLQLCLDCEPPPPEPPKTPRCVSRDGRSSIEISYHHVIIPLTLHVTTAILNTGGCEQIIELSQVLTRYCSESRVTRVVQCMRHVLSLELCMPTLRQPMLCPPPTKTPPPGISVCQPPPPSHLHTSFPRP